MDFDQLTTFLEVVKNASFSRAADKVLRSQPTISVQIRQLEEEYGEKLLIRNGRSVRPTPAGEILVEYARRILDTYRESRQKIADHKDTPRGVLSIGANEATFLYVLRNALTHYRSAFPDVKISVYRNFSYKVLHKLEDGTLELGVATLPIRGSNLKIIPIRKDRVMLMVAGNHPLSQQESVSIADMKGLPIILPSTGYIRRLIDRHLMSHGAVVSMQLSSVVMIKEFVAAGFGASLVSEGFVGEEVRNGTIAVRPLEGLELHRELGLVYRRDRPLSNAARAFVITVRQELAEKRKQETT